MKIFLENQEGKFLLVRRSPVKYPDVKDAWDIVGGRIEIGVPLLENLRREVEEETKLRIISEPRLICAQDIIRNTEKYVVRLSYFGMTSGEPVLDTSENIEYRWLTIDEMKHWDALDQYVKEILEKGYL